MVLPSTVIAVCIYRDVLYALYRHLGREFVAKLNLGEVEKWGIEQLLQLEQRKWLL